MSFPSNFVTAIAHAFRYEIGPWFDPNDSDTISGNINTPLQKRKCGYVDIDGDSGGCTKYGISQTENPNVHVASLNLEAAYQIYFDSYWVAGACDKITIPITIFQLDMDINNGVSRANKILQQAVGVVVDGQIGPMTLAVVNAQNPANLINSLSIIRTQRYNTIVQNDPSQAKFLAGWLRRVSEVTQFSLSQLQT